MVAMRRAHRGIQCSAPVRRVDRRRGGPGGVGAGRVPAEVRAGAMWQRPACPLHRPSGGPPPPLRGGGLILPCCLQRGSGTMRQHGGGGGAAPCPVVLQSYFGSKTLLTTWMTPFDWLTSAIETLA